jgi:hypothetical protein
MKLGWCLVVVLAFVLAWAKYSLDRRVYRLLWYLAAVTVFAIGLAL